MEGYKVFTHDLRPPIQGGDPVWNGQTPFELPRVDVDSTNSDCGSGWNFCREAHTALRIAGLWPNGRPSRLFRVSAEDCVERGDKCRSSQLTIVEEITDLKPAIVDMSSPFSDLAEEMAMEQLAWREALSRPMKDISAIKSGLQTALTSRGLANWTIKQYPTARDARDARDALMVFYASRRGWVKVDPNILTVGIRDAYRNGLAIAIPTGPGELGWAVND
jgi:hypothetical protein